MMNASGLSAQLQDRWHRTTQFLSQDVWLVRLETLPWRRAAAYRAARVLYCTLRGLFGSGALTVRAAALTYYTVLSVVPLLASAFALLKGFGAYQSLVEQSIRPYVNQTLAANEPLQRAVDNVLELVSRTNVTSLGFLGLFVVLYSGTRLLRGIEGALNALWNVESARRPLQQATDYLAIIVIMPLSMLLAAALGTFSQLAAAVRAIGDVVHLGGAAETLVGVLLPASVVFLALCFLYVVMPNTKVRASSAALGAIIGASLWWGVLVAHVRFQVGVARYNALYAGFGAIPIFLVWLDVSWLVVLVGADVAASHQQEHRLAARKRAQGSEQVLRETVCVAAMLEVTRAFLSGEAPLRLAGLSASLNVPPPLLDEIVVRLCERGLLLRTGAQQDAVALAMSPDRIDLKQLLDSMRRPAGLADRVVAPVDNLPPAVAEAFEALDAELAHSVANRTLRELASEPASAAH